MNAPLPPDRYRVPALARGLDILALFGGERETFTAPEVCRALGLPRTSVFRLIATLEAFGWLERVNASAYRIGPALERFARESRPGVGGAAAQSVASLWPAPTRIGPDPSQTGFVRSRRD